MEDVKELPKQHKTYKRELALVLILGVAYFAAKGDVDMVDSLTWPVLTFAAAAFGMDAFVKQAGIKR